MHRLRQGFAYQAGAGAVTRAAIPANQPSMQSDRPTEDAIRLDVEALNRFLDEAFPLQAPDDRGRVTAVSPGHVRMTMLAGDTCLRPGGIVSGPTQMALADVAAYALVLAHIGPVAMTVTSSLTIHFLRPCPAGAVTAEARLLRLGRRIVTVEVSIWAERPEAPVAQATLAYAQP